jgi:DNA-directed RNA polymerase specialized sigma24 family protein
VVTDDEELLERIRERDSAALRVLFHRYQGRVFHFVLRRLGDARPAEEAVANVFFEVWRSAHRLPDGWRPSTWIHGIAHFKAAGAHRDRGRLGAGADRAHVEPLHGAPERDDPLRHRRGLEGLRGRDTRP